MQRAFYIAGAAFAQVRDNAPKLYCRVNFELYGTMLGWRDGDVRHLAEIV